MDTRLNRDQSANPNPASRLDSIQQALSRLNFYMMLEKQLILMSELE